MSAHNPVPGDQPRVLLVHDRPESRRAVEAALAPLGITLSCATPGADSSRLLLEHEFAVILLDVRAPAIEGLEIARLIKGRQPIRDIPIILMTTEGDDVLKVGREYHTGVVDYAPTPIRPELLRAKVAILVELQRSRSALRQSESLLRGAFDSSPTGMTVLDQRLRIVRANPSFARLMGVELSRLEMVEVSDLCDSGDCGKLTAALREALAGCPGAVAPAAGDVELRMRSSTELEVWLTLIASLIGPQGGTEPLLLCQWADLSVRRRAEQARAELLLAQAARVHAEAVAERLHRLQALTDALGLGSVGPLVDELVVRIADLLAVDACEVRIEQQGHETVARALAGHLVVAGDEADWPRSGSWVRESLRIERLGAGEIAVHLPVGRALSGAELSLLREAGDRVSLAIRQTSLFEAEHRTAVELQRGLLPKQLPEIPGLRLAAHYRAAGAGAEVGGDWYDAFALAGGRLGVVVGDVAGSGIPAASTMGQMRAVTRALAVQDHQMRSPGEVLTRLNRYQLALDEPQFVTVLYAILDPAARTVEWASAGHLPPLLRTGGGEVRYLDGGSYPLGTEDVEYEDIREQLDAPGTLVLYTDGLVERRGESIDVGLTRLERAAGAGPLEPLELCEYVLEHVLTPAVQLQDDVTALLVEMG